MKKLKHSKYKNTGLLFEILVRKLTSETLSSDKTITVDIIKKYFGKNTELSKENLIDKLYNMTETLGKFIEDYTDKLGNADKTFRRRLTKGKDQRNPDFN